MEQIQRYILYAALLIVGLLLWNAWKKDYPTKIESQATVTQQQIGVGVGGVGAVDGSNQVPQSVPASAGQQQPLQKTPENRLIKIRTDVLNVSIDTLGGNIVDISLPKYPKTLKSTEPFQLLSDDPQNFYVAESALLSKMGPDTESALAQYQTPQNVYTLAPNQNQLQITLTWKNAQGLEINKTYMFERNQYVIKVIYQIINNSDEIWQGNFYTQISRQPAEGKSTHLFEIHPFYGAAISSPQKRYQEISFKAMEQNPLKQAIRGGWIAMVQRYFVSAWVPDPSQTFNYYSKVNNGIYSIGIASAPIVVAPGATHTVSAKFYAGPEIAQRLEAVAPGLELTISYGWLWFISIVIFWVMEKIYWVVGNWDGQLSS